MIGVTTYVEQAQQGVWDVPAAYLQYQYVESVTAAGGTAVLLPPQPSGPDLAHSVLDRIDALVLSGGKDVDAGRYGEEPHPTADAPRPERDAFEIDLVRAALDRDLPVLGICRGAQVLNVAMGGTLVQHLPDVTGADTHRAGPGVFAPRSVHTVDGTVLASLVGESCEVHCYHHQAVAEVAEGLVVSARAEDGVIEALELPAARFAVAVQWHPEETRDDMRLFEGLVRAAGRVASEKEAMRA